MGDAFGPCSGGQAVPHLDPACPTCTYVCPRNFRGLGLALHLRTILEMEHAGLLCLAAALLAASGCGLDTDVAEQEQNVTVVTDSEQAWAQYLANVEFAQAYQPVCVGADDESPRVLVTGFGRFLSNSVNASGQLVAELIVELDYPMTEAPAPGLVDDPAPQTRVALGTRQLPGLGSVQICAMVLPVYWDLAAYLVLAEMTAFEPHLVIMNGIAGPVQPLWLELGSVNRAMGLPDGSGALEPVEGAPLVPAAPEDEYSRGLLLSWWSVRQAAEATIAEHAGDLEGDRGLTEVLPGVRFAGYPRNSNTYLCNNTTYTVGYLMDHPDEVVPLLVPSSPREGYPSGLDVWLDQDFSSVPRVFVHWPSQLAGAHLGSAAVVLEAMLVAQLAALQSTDDQPTRGDNAIADIPPSP